jgi:hypothetical protein
VNITDHTNGTGEGAKAPDPLAPYKAARLESRGELNVNLRPDLAGLPIEEVFAYADRRRFRSITMKETVYTKHGREWRAQVDNTKSVPFRMPAYMCDPEYRFPETNENERDIARTKGHSRI